MHPPRVTRDHLALLTAITAPIVVSAALIPVRTSIANTDAALVLVAAVVAVAAAGNRLAGYLAAASSALWFDFFLTRPYERFTISRHPDLETTLLLLVIGIAVTELAVWGRRQAACASRRAGYVSGLYAAAEAAAGTDHSSTDVIRQVGDQLTMLLELRSCQFQHGLSGVGGPARLHHDGRLALGERTWPIDRRGFPPDTPVELLVENGGLLHRGSGPDERPRPQAACRGRMVDHLPVTVANRCYGQSYSTVPQHHPSRGM